MEVGEGISKITGNGKEKCMVVTRQEGVGLVRV